MKDILTAEEKARLEKDGATIVSGEPEMPLPPDFEREYDGYHVMYRMVGSTIVKDARGKAVHLGCPPGRALVAIASPGSTDKLLTLVKDWPDYKNRKILFGGIQAFKGPFVAAFSLRAPRH